MKKILIGLVVLIAVAAVIGTVFVVGKLDEYIAQVIETEGTKALGAQVTVESVETKFKEGVATINGLAIANPGGYQSPNAIELGSFSADVDYKSQVVEKILIEQPIINAELKGGRSNFQDLVDNMPAGAEEETDEPASGDEPVITIKSLQLLKAQVNLIADELGGQRSFVMDDFILNDLNGTPTQISERVTRALTNHISAQVTGFATEEIARMVEEKAKEKISEVIDEKLGGDVQEKLGEKLGDKVKLKDLKLKFN